MVYKPKGVIHHIGPNQEGHFYTDLLLEEGWTRLNDSTVHKLDKASTDSDSAYIILLSRKDTMIKFDQISQAANPLAFLENFKIQRKPQNPDPKTLSITPGLKGNQKIHI